MAINPFPSLNQAPPLNVGQHRLADRGMDFYETPANSQNDRKRAAEQTRLH
jgi:hypothetical protein